MNQHSSNRFRNDWEERMAPSEKQEVIAQNAFWLNGCDHVIMPVLFLDKTFGVWGDGIEVVHIHHLSMSFSDDEWRGARERAISKAENALAALRRSGTIGVINWVFPENNWSVFEYPCAEVPMERIETLDTWR